MKKHGEISTYFRLKHHCGKEVGHFFRAVYPNKNHVTTHHVNILMNYTPLLFSICQISVIIMYSKQGVKQCGSWSAGFSEAGWSGSNTVFKTGYIGVQHDILLEILYNRNFTLFVLYVPLSPHFLVHLLLVEALSTYALTEQPLFDMSRTFLLHPCKTVESHLSLKHELYS